jgi:hypothetical protein
MSRFMMQIVKRGVTGICAVFLVGAAHMAHAGINVWTRQALAGGGVRAMAIDPLTASTLYAAADGVVFKSTNAGATWSAFDAGLTNFTGGFSVSVLAIDPITTSRLYAGTQGGGVFSIQQVAVCVGDCSANGSVTVDGVITLVTIALGAAPASACALGIAPGAEVDIALIIQAVNHTVNGCRG